MVYILLLSLMFIVNFPISQIYQNIISPFHIYTPLQPSMRMSTPVLYPAPTATVKKSPEKKKVYAF